MKKLFCYHCRHIYVTGPVKELASALAKKSPLWVKDLFDTVYFKSDFSGIS
ncbi:hypothetical protein [Mucilaginibacter sp.]|uniref:hypothetical protein n=1 Tax=Mucilaginibacter sp. TaxID=1882438 RepID=UPI002635163E|nr:hypothetical protein [Mucilaginibacter sp.]